MTKIAFIGLGNMGLPMAKNLFKAGYEVKAFDLSDRAMMDASQQGLTCGTSLNHATMRADILITMLPKGEHVLAVYRDAIENLAEGATVIDCSTIDIASTRTMHELAKINAIESLDAPVSGGVAGANAATLTFMIGGSESTFAAKRQLFEAMGKNIVYCGATTSGQAAKICNNMILGISMIAVCEAFVLGEKLGLSPDALFEVASTSSGKCWSLTDYCPMPGPVPKSPANRGYQPGFAAELMKKDLLLSQEAASTAEAQTPLGSHAAKLYSMYVEQGGRGVDFSGIIQWLRQNQSLVS
jgi:3-hydroxyisobutyrate dehydrogenase